MASEPLAHDSGGRPLYVGTPVRFTHDVAHLYDEGKSGRWYVESLGDRNASVYPLADKAPPDAKSRMAACRVLQIRDTTTSVWAFAPALWLVAAGEESRSPERDELRDLALVLLKHRNDTMRDIMIALLAWGADYVHRTNPHAERHDVEEIPITVPFLTILAQKFGHANIGCLATTESVAAAVDVALGQIATLQKRLDTQADFYGRIEAEHAELKRRVDEARKAFGG